MSPASLSEPPARIGFDAGSNSRAVTSRAYHPSAFSDFCCFEPLCGTQGEGILPETGHGIARRGSLALSGEQVLVGNKKILLRHDDHPATATGLGAFAPTEAACPRLLIDARSASHPTVGFGEPGSERYSQRLDDFLSGLALRDRFPSPKARGSCWWRNTVRWQIFTGATVPCWESATAVSPVILARGVAALIVKSKGFCWLSIISSVAPTARRS